jgi:hypothetical protein
MDEWDFEEDYYVPERDPDSDVSAAFYPPREMENDDYRAPRSPSGPLLLDNLLGGRPRASNSHLLQLPAEILAKIVDLLCDDGETLRNLALVNTDCRLLAHASQFPETTLEFSPGTFAWIKTNTNRAMGGASVDSERLPPIINCVRRATFCPNPR